MPFPPLFQTNKVKERLSKRIAELSREDLQRSGGSTNNEPDIEQLRQIEKIIQNPETYDPLSYPPHTMLDKFKQHGVFTPDEIDNLRRKLDNTERKRPPFHPST